MRYGKLKAGLAIAATLGGMTVLAVQPAYADYAPTSSDAVGVGSDTLQYLVDFVADGDNTLDPGYNSNGPKSRLINFDATADANARLAYGPGGVNGDGVAASTTTLAGATANLGKCGPGNGGTAGTGNQTATHADSPCTLDPTIVVRAGVSPIQRPNGSGAGAKAILNDPSHLLTFTRASSAQGATLGSAFDAVQVGTDPLAMLTASTTNAPPLSSNQLNAIYSCTVTTWSQVGGTGPGAGDTIIPIIPQVGSGTRSTFLSSIGSPNLGSCVVTGEENDPTAIAAQANPADAIEPMSGGRLNLFLGLLSTGAANSTVGGTGGYFKDPSCALNNINSNPPTTGCAASANTVSPAVKLVTSGTPSDANPLFNISRPLYIYFRAVDVNSTTPFEPGSTLNAIRTLFYNPCITGQTCTAGTGPLAGQSFGPGGPPVFAQVGSFWPNISSSGITPTYQSFVPGP